MAWLAPSYLEHEAAIQERVMNFYGLSHSLERVETVQNTIPVELERCDLFRKSKARVAKLNALNPELVSGITSMMDGEALFEKISSYGRSFVTVKVQAVDNEAVFLWTGLCLKPNDVWSGLKHSRESQMSVTLKRYTVNASLQFERNPIAHCVVPERCPG